jgi:hypothetical protein
MHRKFTTDSSTTATHSGCTRKRQIWRIGHRCTQAGGSGPLSREGRRRGWTAGCRPCSPRACGIAGRSPAVGALAFESPWRQKTATRGRLGNLSSWLRLRMQLWPACHHGLAETRGLPRRLVLRLRHRGRGALSQKTALRSGMATWRGSVGREMREIALRQRHHRTWPCRTAHGACSTQSALRRSIGGRPWHWHWRRR